jgi:hypothetical protein
MNTNQGIALIRGFRVNSRLDFQQEDWPYQRSLALRLRFDLGDTDLGRLIHRFFFLELLEGAVTIPLGDFLGSAPLHRLGAATFFEALIKALVEFFFHVSAPARNQHKDDAGG